MVAIVMRLKGLLGLFIILFILSQCRHEDAEPVPLEEERELPLPEKSCDGLIDLGYTDKLSYLPGEKVKVFVEPFTVCDSCKMQVYSFNGSLTFEVPASLWVQPRIPEDAYQEGYGYRYPVTFKIPTDLKSGVYMIAKRIPFFVKSKSVSDMVVVYPSNTANAYCTSGGQSLYSQPVRARAVSFLRPMDIQKNSEVCLQWFQEQKEASVSFIVDSDMDNYSNIDGSKLLVIIGHSEYWTREARVNFDRFVNQGGNALILSGNTMWWKVRYEDGNTKMVCYKDTSDPYASAAEKTINWNSPELNYSIVNSIGADFPKGGYGLKTDAGWDGYKIVSPQSPLLEGLNLKKGDIIKLPSGEYDGAPLSGFDAEGYPILDRSSMDFYKAELIGFDRGSRFEKETIGTFIVVQKSSSSGIVINAASYDWCSARGMGGEDGNAIKTITSNAINKLLKNQPVFSN